MGDEQLNQIIGVVFAVLSMLFIAFGVRSFIRRRAFLRISTAIDGTVVRIEEHTDSEGTSYAPIVQFRTSDGEVHEIEPDIATGSPRHRVGQRLPVRYDPQQPEKARITTSFYNWFAPLLLWALAALCGGLGLLFLSL